MTRSVALGFVIALAGFIFGVMPFGVDIEEEIGLALLFRLRGVRPAPSDVAVVGIDKKSSDALGLKNDPRKWPRTLHAELTEKLAAAGAAGIAFDIFFEEPRSGNEDMLFAAAVKKANRVILCQRLQSERHQAADGSEIYSEQLVSPLPGLEDAALALAPFPLPKIPKSIIRSWTFRAGSGDRPTMPVAAFQLYAMDVYDDFVMLMKKAGAKLPSELPADRRAVLEHDGLLRAVQEIRIIFGNTPLLAEKMNAIADSEFPEYDRGKSLIRSLISMYGGDERRYMNFYGPPGTITTIPYDRMLRGDAGTALKGKLVFVGFSELYQPEQKDTFYTVFSEEDGRDISGIELAATGFSNLLENMPVRPLGFGAYAAVLLVWGFAAGAACRFFPTFISGGIVATAVAIYLGIAFMQFRASGLWYPVVIPVFFQPASAFFGSLIWKYAEANRERQNIRNAVGFYLPPDVVDRLAKNLSGMKTESRTVHGVCLYTDAEGYTGMAESMDTEKLGRQMNQYYEAVFKPIKEHGGTVSNVVGDSVLALWLGTETVRERFSGACRAALDISQHMQTFHGAGGVHMPTRIGIHAGQIMLGNLGAMDHFEYRPVGDIINATTRLDGLNKRLGTRILITENVAENLEGFVIRDLGTFLVVGKSRPVKIYELICRMEALDGTRREACMVFAGALALFAKGDWDAAENVFQAYCSRFGEDGPARFYLDKCRQYQADPPAGQWDGIIRMDVK